jgi:hypothetical protein
VLEIAEGDVRVYASADNDGDEVEDDGEEPVEVEVELVGEPGQVSEANELDDDEGTMTMTGSSEMARKEETRRIGIGSAVRVCSGPHTGGVGTVTSEKSFWLRVTLSNGSDVSVRRYMLEGNGSVPMARTIFPMSTAYLPDAEFLSGSVPIASKVQPVLLVMGTAYDEQEHAPFTDYPAIRMPPVAFAMPMAPDDAATS